MQARRCGIAIGFDYIEPAWRVRMPRVSQQERLRRAHQLAALATVHRRRPAPERSAGPVAHFDEHEGVAAGGWREHYQVKFTAPRAFVAGEQVQALGLQVGEGGTFDVVAAGAAIRAGLSAHRRPGAAACRR